MTAEEKAEEYAIKITDELRNKGFLTNEEIDQRYAGIVQGVLYGFAEGKKETFSEEVIKNLKENTSVINSVIINKLSEKCEQLEKENAELKAQNKDLCESLDIMNNRESELLDQIKEMQEQNEKMKSNTEDLIKVQSLYIDDNYNAGLLNGLITTYNSIFEERYQCCKWNEHKNRWELAE